MGELISDKADSLPVEIPQDAMPVPEEGKCLYITQESKGFDFQAILGQVIQCVNMSEILSEIKAGTQYVVQIPAEFQAAYESGEMFIMENIKTGKKWPSLMKIAENGKKQVVTPLPMIIWPLRSAERNCWRRWEMDKQFKKQKLDSKDYKGMEQGAKYLKCGVGLAASIALFVKNKDNLKAIGKSALKFTGRVIKI